MTVKRIPESFRRKRLGSAIEFQLDSPSLVVPRNNGTFWTAVQFGQTVADIGISTNPYAELGDPDVAVFLASQGAAYFEVHAESGIMANDLFVIGLPAGVPVSVTEVRKERAVHLRAGRSVRPAFAYETTCHAIPLNFSGGTALVLPEDPQRRRVTFKANSAFTALSTTPETFDFQGFGPFFPGYCVIEGTEAVYALDFGLGPDTVWAIVTREVEA